MPDVTPEQAATFAGAMRVFLERADDWEGRIEKRLAAAHAQKDAMEKRLAARLQDALTGPKGLAFRPDGVVDVTKVAQNRAARRAAMDVTDREFARLSKQLLPAEVAAA